jgi:hypothetical protein
VRVFGCNFFRFYISRGVHSWLAGLSFILYKQA